MAQHQRASLPHMGHQLSNYSVLVSGNRRSSPVNPRSPTFHIPHRPQITPVAPPPVPTYPAPIPQSPDQSSNPNLPMEEHGYSGTLFHADQAGAQIGEPILPSIACQSYKNFLVDDGEWTCYRRNYISATCSFSLANYTPGARIMLSQSGNPQVDVHGFAMYVCGTVSEDADQTMDLVQYTAKRDKGPLLRLHKVPMAPKGSGQHVAGSYGEGSSVGLSDGYGQVLPTEHIFQRLQYPSATMNNGNRRQTQQYFHLLVELWADIGGAQGTGQYVRVAYRRSRRIIVRGRSPGHYKADRRTRGSTGRGGRGRRGGRGAGGGPGAGGASNLGGGYGTMDGSGGMGDFGQGGMLRGHTTGYNPTYDLRNTHMYGHGGANNTRMGHELSHRDGMDHQTKAYLPPFHGPVYEDQNGRLNMFNQPGEQTATMPSSSLDMYAKQARLEAGVDILPRPSQYTTRSSLQNGGPSFDGRCNTNSIYPSQGLIGNCMLT
ncbi:hypothetical protein K4F52_003746 [Lecanicillium sp. MT-2017a]|nr:hypothetical protein K4F52_003746 [Lecanicillium sp. MT-2017a]